MAAEIKRLRYIDALRGYAILGVIIVHCSVQVPPGLWPPVSTLALEGARGVQLFFVASALTLMLSWHARGDGARAFYIRRVFRIAPMFWLAIPLFLLIYGFAPRGWAPQGISWPHVLATALFVHGFHPQTISSVVPGGSTIAVEMTFYAVFPLLVSVLRSWRITAAALIASICFSALLYPLTIEVAGRLDPQAGPDLIKGFAYSWFPTQLPVFITGILVFHLLRDFTGRLPRVALGVVLGVGIAVLIVIPFVASTKVAFIVYTLDFGVIAFCLGQGVGGLLVNRAIVHLGQISYSAYFWHFAVLWATSPLGLNPYNGQFAAPVLLQFALLLTGVLAVTTLLSTLSYRLIELPMIGVGRQLADWVVARRSMPLAAYRASD